ncbi:cell division protein FtsQ/DivIB [Paenibacillus sp. GCM10023252]|uniref:cell division protein FtsQ/DivIB n=1 Tax=Paenibacillus sp. GCM10023252 TaxID=3252649 RepID=UPI0036191706
MSESIPVLKEPERRRRSSRKLLYVLFLLFIVILSVLFFNSSISKITSITVEGNNYAETEEVKQASGITLGDAFFGTSRGTIASRVGKLKPVEQVTVHKTFPGVVRIVVKEYSVVAFEIAKDSKLSAMLASGSSIPATGTNTLIDKPILSGWKPDDPIKSELSKQLGRLSAKDLSDLSEIHPYPSKAYPDRIKLYTRTGFEVVTAVSVIAEKIHALNAVIETQEPGRITMLLADTYVPFQPDPAENLQSLEKETTQ